ncbi:MAG: NADH:flavin oxidoreductase [Planctomycetes bacterium]|nr:NADH:flavin oxidoreductase [Planctomycetota bacterium]
MLFTPFKINSITLPNRLVVPAMVTRLSGEDGFVNDAIRERYRRFAKGGAGLIVIEAMAVHQAKSGPLLRLGDDQFIPGQRDLAKLMHDSGPGKVVPQIIHFLKIARSGWRQKVDDLSLDDIREIARAYAAAAARAIKCGYDGVELHMAHAYTLSSFLSRLNPRRDDYGGSLENRLRLPLEVVAAVRAEIGREFPLGVRFLGEECIKGGATVEDTRLIALALAKAGVDYLSVSAGGKFEDAVHRPGEPLYPYTGYSGDRCMPGASYPDGANLYMSTAIRACLREHGQQTPVVATGKINTPQMAEDILKRGDADLIGMARPLLADPDWPRKVQAGQFDKVIRCCYANVCKARDEHFQTVACFLWPKGASQAPESDDLQPPQWPASGDGLKIEHKNGRIYLRWNAASDNEGVYGYDVFRAEGAGEFMRLTAVPGGLTTFIDGGCAPGVGYRYQVKAYDFAGNRSAASQVVAAGTA